MSEDINVPEYFLCPITLEIMHEPVVCEDGYTYDKKSIISLKESISPMTRQPINREKLIINRNLKDAIKEFNLKNDFSINEESYLVNKYKKEKKCYVNKYKKNSFLLIFFLYKTIKYLLQKSFNVNIQLCCILLLSIKFFCFYFKESLKYLLTKMCSAVFQLCCILLLSIKYFCFYFKESIKYVTNQTIIITKIFYNEVYKIFFNEVHNANIKNNILFDIILFLCALISVFDIFLLILYNFKYPVFKNIYIFINSISF